MELESRDKDQASHSANWLIKHARNHFSQFGEDGIIEKVLSLLPDVSKWCVEFGAWDGKYLSNTHYLLSQKGWSGVLIEADPDKFMDLCRTYEHNNRALCIHEMVSFEGRNTLDQILSQTPIPEHFDLLSIDVDGNDYHIWKSLVRYRPKVVIIEFNNSIPNNVAFVQKADFKVNQGSSLLSLYRLAKSKEYELVAVTDFTAFFVDAPYFPLFGIKDNRPEAINDNRKYITQVFQLYDGTLVWTGNLKLLWHGKEMDPERLQVLPRACRVFPGLRSSRLRRLWCSCRKRLRI